MAPLRSPSSPPLLFSQSSCFHGDRSYRERDWGRWGECRQRSTTVAATRERQHTGGSLRSEQWWGSLLLLQPHHHSPPCSSLYTGTWYPPKKAQNLSILLRLKMPSGQTGEMEQWRTQKMGVEISSLHYYPYAIPVINKNKLFFALVAQWLSLNANFSHWPVSPLLFPYYPSFKNASL